MAEPENPADVTALTVQLLSAYLPNNTVASENLAELIRTTRAALTQDAADQAPSGEPEVHTPAVSVRKSLSSPEYLISLIDGKRYKTLKRHLAGHGLTPDTYRERYGLPASYPMVAPAFADMRREIAGRIGLGRRRQADAAPVPSETAMKAPEDAVNASDPANVALAASASPATPSKGAKPASPKTASASRKATAAPKSTPKPEAPGSALAEAANPDVRGDGKKEAKPRKAKPAAGTTVLSADTAAPTAPANADTSSATVSDVKPKEDPAKRPLRSAAKSTDPKTASSDPVEALAPGTDVASEVPAKATPKRRGKLGLFKKGRGTDAGAPAETAAVVEIAAPSTEQAEESKPAKVKVAKPKRMARTPKSAGTDAG